MTGACRHTCALGSPSATHGAHAPHLYFLGDRREQPGVHLDPQHMGASEETPEQPVVRDRLVAGRQDDLLTVASIDRQRDHCRLAPQPGCCGRGHGELTPRFAGAIQQEPMIEDASGPQSHGPGLWMGRGHARSAGVATDGRIGPPISTTSAPWNASAWAMPSRTS